MWITFLLPFSLIFYYSPFYFFSTPTLFFPHLKTYFSTVILQNYVILTYSTFCVVLFFSYNFFLYLVF